jgi:hypothetical protein
MKRRELPPGASFVIEIKRALWETWWVRYFNSSRETMLKSITVSTMCRSIA